MSDDNLRSQTEQHTENEKEREIFDVMRNENADLMDSVFTFGNVLLVAVVLGTLILILYGVNAFIG